MNISLSPFAPDNLASRDGFGRPVLRQSVHLHTQAESGAYLRDSSRFPRRRPFIYLSRHTPSGQSRVYWVTQLRTDYVHSSCALSLRNLVAGYECGRVFPACVGPGSPSRDATSCLSSRLSPLIETRRRYAWLMIVFPGVRLARAPIWCPSGGVAARERQGTLSRRAW